MNFKVAALPEILQDNGYHTILSGKWHLGLEPELGPHSRGFNRSFSMLSGCHNHYAYEPQYGDGDNGHLKVYEDWAPAVAHKKMMYAKEGEYCDM